MFCQRWNNVDKHKSAQLSFSTKFQRWNNVDSPTLNQYNSINVETTSINVRRLNFHFQPSINVDVFAGYAILRSDSKFQSSIMCSDTECLEVLIVLHICSFLMSNDSGNMSLGDIETILSYNQSIEISRELSLDKFDF